MRLTTDSPARVVVDYSASEEIDVWWGFSIWTGDQAICVTGSHDLTDRRLLPGSGQLSCTLPVLPLIPGRYRISANIVDRHNSQAFAQFGRDDHPTFLDVSAMPNHLVNAQMQMGQLVTLNVAWDR